MTLLLALVVLVLGLWVERLSGRVRALEVDVAQLGAELDHVSGRGPLALALVALLGLGASGCSLPQAFVLPLPFGHSSVVAFERLDECEQVHESVHQRQVEELGTAKFLATIAFEYVAYDDPTCASLENEAYLAELECYARAAGNQDYLGAHRVACGQSTVRDHADSSVEGPQT